MENKVVEIFIPGPAGRLEAKYYKSKKFLGTSYKTQQILLMAIKWISNFFRRGSILERSAFSKIGLFTYDLC